MEAVHVVLGITRSHHGGRLPLACLCLSPRVGADKTAQWCPQGCRSETRRHTWEPVVPALTHWLAQLNVVTGEDTYKSMPMTKAHWTFQSQEEAEQLQSSPAKSFPLLLPLPWPFCSIYFLSICVTANIQALTVRPKLPSTPGLACESQSQVAWAGSPTVPAFTGQETSPTSTPFLYWLLICRMGIITAVTHRVVMRPE